MASAFEIHLRQPILAGAAEVSQRGCMAGVILSAGASRRMGAPKALLRYQGETFLDRLIRLLSAVCEPVVVVLGHDAGAIRAGLEPHQNATFTLNPDPERGMLSSLQCGLRIAPPEARAVMFTPVDHPNVAAATIEALAQAFVKYGAPVTLPVYQGRNGHPVCITRDIAAELLALPVTAQAKDVIHRYSEHTRRIEVADPGVVADIDDREAYRALIASEGGLPKAANL